MTQTVPAPIATFFAGSNFHDTDAALAAFGDNAVVIEEGQTFSGLPAIRTWMDAVSAKYGVTATVTDVNQIGPVHHVEAMVTGNFPGSPAVLHFDFTLADERIAKLSIG